MADADAASATRRLWWSLPENFSTYDEYRTHLRTTGKFQGSAEMEILALLALGPASVFLTWGFVTWNLGSLHSTTRIDSKILLFFEFLFILVASLTALTFGSDSPESLLTTVVVAALGFAVAIDRRESVMSAAGRKTMSFFDAFRQFPTLELPPQKAPTEPNGIDGVLRQSVAEYRSLVLIVTVICILAVDFPTVFPDKFHKSATFGTSIMDLGVGGFIVANGLVAKEARSPPMLPGTKRPSIRAKFQAGVVNLKQTVRSCFLLAGLGLLRAAAVAVTGYHVAVTEYGVHWNFFLTLAAVKLIAAATFTIIPHRMAWVAGVWNLTVYQMALSFFGLQRVVLFGFRAFSWITDETCPQNGATSAAASSDVTAVCAYDPRQGILEANREGIFSVWGFLSLYFFSVQLGRAVFRPKSKVSDWMKVGSILIITSAASLMMYLMLIKSSTGVLLLPSRRLANASYVLWTLGNCCFPVFLSLTIKILIVFMSYQHGLRGRLPDTVLMHSINGNPLSFFLVANLMTGFINLVFPTLLMDPISATFVLVAYLVVLTLFAYTLFKFRIRLA